MTDPDKVSLGDYVTDDGQYFYFKGDVYVTAGNGMSAGDVGVRSWDTGETSWMDPGEQVQPVKLPSRPMPPIDSFINCPDTTQDEMRRALLRYRRKMEEYVDALEKLGSSLMATGVIPPSPT